MNVKQLATCASLTIIASTLTSMSACWASKGILLSQAMPVSSESNIPLGRGTKSLIADAAIQPAAASTDDQALTALNELSDLCRHMKGSIKSLISETQNLNYNNLTNATMGNYSYAEQAFARGNQPGANYEPLKKKWVDFHMSQMAFLYSELLQQDTGLKAVTSVPGTAEIYSDLQNEATNFSNAYKRLVEDTKAAPYNNLIVASDAQAMQVSIDRIEQDRKDLAKKVKRDEKH